MDTGSISVYDSILKIFPTLLNSSKGSFYTLNVGLFMPLNVVILSYSYEHMVISIYQNGFIEDKIMFSPRMEIYLNHDQGIAYAMTYQNDYMKVDYKVRMEIAGKLLPFSNMTSSLDLFLEKWMCHLIESFLPEKIHYAI